ncbi:uncharacterized protein LOC111019796 [Momordica charantia]|uniref:Uncharacterized protein LOC111019796 n=1 Tax=Momordica charantia TaxID=3673 RepID=A0A6J1DEV2_MOMCH|nr:uncharacterized protein LOC111019796 [Momordica charantia]
MFVLQVFLVAFMAGHAHVSNICGKADDVPLCRSMVKGATDPVAATKASIDQLITETKRAKEASVQLGKSSFMGACTQNFGDNILNLQEGLQALKSRDKGTLMSSLSAVVSLYSGCDDAIGEGGIVTQAAGIVSINSQLIHMASNCLYLADLT